MLIAGAILLAIAAGILLVARSHRAKARAARLTETLSCGDLASLAGGVGAEVGGGLFSQRCEVVGQAAAGESGLISAPHSGADAVWHHSTVKHRYWEMEERRDKVDKPERVVDRFDPQVSEPTGSSFLASLFHSGADGGTLGFGYEEWIIRPGATLYVHGTVSDKTGRPGFAKDGRYIISSRSEEGIVGQAESIALWTAIGAGAAAAIGVVLVVMGLLA